MFEFHKFQALGNDFVLLDARAAPLDLSASTICALADRHHGVGCDQVLLLEPAKSSAADCYYRMFNADGGEVAQCGNGARAVVKYLYETTHPNSKITLQTHVGFMSGEYLGPAEIKVYLGMPQFLESRQVGKYSLACVDIGNPHAVLINVEADVALAEEISAQFPAGINVNFVSSISDRQFALTVYERGVGFTLACGSGAAASSAVLKRAGAVQLPVQVSQPGGELTVFWPAAEEPIAICGEAQWVFTGVYR